MARLRRFTGGLAALRSLWRPVAAASALCLAGCGAQILNLQPAQELAQLSKPPGSVYVGWRVFQDRCARCHGSAATGAADGPDLLPRIRELGPRSFVSLVLRRYDWGLPAARASESMAREALIDDVLQRKAGALTMPAWQGEPRVTAHIIDLHAYLWARADGRQDAGRPSP